ncbi:MAG: hypothetical protein K9L70_07930 [Thiohalocapsa sp.]|nr:hypothetical protein [Thiohalocapsa sp.]MCF7991578.1 hypothetical protein [Thiohalocapsa sp.]
MTNHDETIQAVEAAGQRIADAITPFVGTPGQDAAGGHVGSLTEAVMGMTASLMHIADAVSELAAAVRDAGADAPPVCGPTQNTPE